MWTDLARWLRSLRGRLLAVALVVAAGVVGGYAGYTTTAPYYATQGAVVVLPPGAGRTDAGQNPFANLFNSTQFTAVIATHVRSEATRDRVAASGARRDYTIETVAREVRANFAQNAAQIEYSLNAPDPDSAQRGAEALVAAIRDVTRTIQTDAGVPGDRLARIQVAVPAPRAHEVTGGLVIAALTDGAIAVLICGALLLTWRFVRHARAVRAGPTKSAVTEEVLLSATGRVTAGAESG